MALLGIFLQDSYNVSHMLLHAVPYKVTTTQKALKITEEWLLRRVCLSTEEGKANSGQFIECLVTKP